MESFFEPVCVYIYIWNWGRLRLADRLPKKMCCAFFSPSHDAIVWVWRFTCDPELKLKDVILECCWLAIARGDTGIHPKSCISVIHRDASKEPWVYQYIYVSKLLWNSDSYTYENPKSSMIHTYTYILYIYILNPKHSKCSHCLSESLSFFSFFICMLCFPSLRQLEVAKKNSRANLASLGVGNLQS